MRFTGEQLYNNYRQAWNKAAERRAHQAGIRHWKDLRPWMAGVWNDMAASMSDTYTFYVEGDRVKVDDTGKYHLGTVIRTEVDWKVWVKLDVGDNPILCDNDELEALDA